MRILSSADHHFDQHSRFDECIRIHEWMVNVAREERVDAFLSAGDLYERASTPQEREAASEWLRAMAEVCPVVIAKGNHDRELDCQLLAKLKTKHPIFVEEAAGVHYVAGAAIAAVAWPDRAKLLTHMAQQFDQHVSSEEADEGMLQRLRGLLSELGHLLKEHDGPRILLGHFMCDGAETSTGQPLLGQPIRVGLGDLALAQAHLTVMGHIHKYQEWEGATGPILYVGSPFRTDYGQLEDKSVSLVEFDGARLVSQRRIITPANGMVHLESAWSDEGWETPPDVVVEGAEVRFRYEVAREHREAASSAAQRIADELRNLGAVDVKVEAVLKVEKRAKVPELALSRTTGEKLEAYWRSVDFDPGPRRADLLRKVELVETACASGVVSPPAVRLRRARIHKIGTIEDFELDLDKLPADEKLIAFVAPNGTGKTLALESMIPGALYRQCPTNGRLQRRAQARDSFVEVTVDTDATWTIKHMFDNVSGKGESVVFDAAGAPAYEGTGVKKFEAWAPRHVPTEDLLFSTQFFCQRGAGPRPRLPFIDLGSAERISVILQAIGVERYEAMASLARDKAQTTGQELERTQVRLDDERARIGDVDALQAALDAARAAAAAAEEELASHRAVLAAAEQEARTIQEARDRAEETAKRRAELESSIAAAGERLERLEKKAQDARAIVARAQDIRAAVTRAETLRASLANLELEAERIEERRASARAIEERRKKLQRGLVTIETMVKDIRERIANNRAAIDRREEILAAKKEADDLAPRKLELEASRERLRQDLQTATNAMPALQAKRKALEEQLTEVEKALAERPSVEAAVQQAHELSNALQHCQTTVDVTEKKLEELRAALVSGAERRVGGLRRTLEGIANGTHADPCSVAGVGLREDDARRSELAKLPIDIAEWEAGLAAGRRKQSELRQRLREQETIARRAPAMDAAEKRREGLLEELQTVGAELTVLGDRAVALGTDLSKTAKDAEQVTARLAELAPLTRLFEPLLAADARLAVLEPQLADAEARLAQDQAELSGLPPAEHVPEAPNLHDIRAELSAAEALAHQVEGLAKAEAFLEGQLPQEQAARDEIDRLLQDIARLPAVTLPEPTIDRAAAARAVASGEESVRSATSTVARAEQRLEQYHAGSARLVEFDEQRKRLELELGDWNRLAHNLGRDGLQSAEVDSAGPELTELINDLLHTCHGPRFTVSVDTSRLSADGKKMVDECRVNVIDLETGEEKEVSEFSGGERTILGEAVSGALTVLACRRANVRQPTLVRDETGAALDPQNTRVYVEMLRRQMTLIDAAHLLLVSHAPEVWSLVDAVVDMTQARRGGAPATSNNIAA